MDWSGRVGGQFAALGVVDLHVLHPLHELLDRTLNCVPLAHPHVSSVVLDPDVLLEGEVLVELEEDVAAVEDVLDAVERGRFLALELLLYALGAREVEHVHVRPKPALMHEDETHFGRPRLLGSRAHLFPK